jgi:hypothetical protein
MTMIVEKLHTHNNNDDLKTKSPKKNQTKFHKTTFNNEYTATLSGELVMAQWKQNLHVNIYYKLYWRDICSNEVVMLFSSVNIKLIQHQQTLC